MVLNFEVSKALHKYFLTSPLPYLDLNFLTMSSTLLLSVIGLPLAGISMPFTEIFNVESASRKRDARQCIMHP